jgi:hypothetical protein
MVVPLKPRGEDADEEFGTNEENVVEYLEGNTSI